MAPRGAAVSTIYPFARALVPAARARTPRTEYVTREGEYADRDPAIYTESDHMPSWAADSPSEYWDAADLYERANGRLYVSADFALPRDLSPEDQIALARDLAQELTRMRRCRTPSRFTPAAMSTGRTTTRTHI